MLNIDVVKNVNRYGVREQTQTNSPAELHAEQVRVLGYTVVESHWSPEQLENWRRSLDELNMRQEAAAGGREELARIGEADTVRAPLAGDETFLEVATNETILQIAAILLGDYFILMQQNGIINRPVTGELHRQAAYHRDLPYQHFVSSRPIAINALLCLDPFLVETGCTHVLQASHKMEAFPSDAYIERMELPVSAEAGSYILMDSMLYHRAGINRSSASRRAVNQVYALPFIKQQIALPSLLAGRWSEAPFLNRLLGYDSNPPANVEEYRALRQRRATRADANS